MEFTKFKQMATDYADFITEIEKVSKEYCLLKNININPMDDYYMHETYAEDATTFEIDENNIIIHYIWDIGTCGETDWDHRSLRIPMDFFNPENRNNQEIEIKRTLEKIKNLEKDLRSAENKLRNFRSEERDIQNDKWKMQSMTEKYNLAFDKKVFEEKKSKMDEKIKIQNIVVESLRKQIEKLKK